MADEEAEGLGGLFRRLQRKTAEVIAEQQAALARGRVAGVPVEDGEGGFIVQAGDRIDDAAIEHAARTGKLPALAASAAAAVGQDLRERASEALGSTPEGREDRELESAVDYARARRLVGMQTGIAVTDVRGEVIVPAGARISETDVRRARAAGQLGALEHAARQPYVAEPSVAESPAEEASTAAPEDDAPARRASLPIVEPPGDT